METAAGSVHNEEDLLEPLAPDPSRPAPPPPPGRLKRTAFKFFSSRRSICVLPSFFGGLGKGPGRGSASKLGVTKSRTHDGVSRGCWNDTIRGGGDVVAEDFDFRSPRELNSGTGEPSRVSEGLKAQFLPWQRRGLRGLFSSIRRHRRSKTTAEVERSVSCLEMSPSACNMPAAASATQQLSHMPSSTRQGGPSEEPTVPDAAACEEDPLLSEPVAAVAESVTAERMVPHRRSGGREKTGRSETEGKRRSRERAELATTAGEALLDRGSLQKNLEPLCAESELKRLAEPNPEATETEPPAAASLSEHASLVFGDVSSLKSFDSLTGCGDIIADQDDDSAAESSISGERGSRGGGGKRSSCLVTYQGGGEEMATPDEADGDYLEDLWEAKTANEVCYIPAGQQAGSLPITPDQPISSLHTITTPTTTSSSCSGGTMSSCSNSSPLGVLETVLGPAELATPQSDHQESVPNSDEGYYDSTTPGADDDAAATTRDQPRPDRLPRDSYSGDALYELFEPDDRLLSPSLPDSDPFLSVPLPGGTDGQVSPVYCLETGAMETEEDRLSKIQQALLCCDLQSLGQGSFFPNSAPNVGVANKKGEGPRSPTSPLHPHYPEDGPLSERETGHHAQDSPSSFSQIPSPLLQEAGLYQGAGASLAVSQSQEELTTVCFSQALVDFTKHSHHIFCNSTESLDGSESGSPFGQNLQALPAIVTFDVVDMENEGEFEQQTELAEGEEELASPFEPFEDESCYLREDAFAECDERMFDAYEQSLFLGGAWGITSLPRHLSSGRTCQPLPAPLGPNRRSRSLDTDSIDLRVCDAPETSGGHPEPVVRAGSLQRKGKNTQSSQPVSDPSSSRHRNGNRRAAFPGQEVASQITNPVPLCQKQLTNCPVKPEMRALAKLSSKPVHQTVSRPSDLPLQAGLLFSGRGRNPGQPGGAAGSNGTYVGPGQRSGESSEVFYHNAAYAEACHSQAKPRLVGVTQAVPHPYPNSAGGGGQGVWPHAEKERSVGGKTVEMPYSSKQSKHGT